MMSFATLPNPKLFTPQWIKKKKKKCTRQRSQLQGSIRVAPSLAFKEADPVSRSEIRFAVLLSASGTGEERGGELIQDLMEKSSVAQGDQSSVAFWRYSRCALAFKKQPPQQEPPSANKRGSFLSPRGNTDWTLSNSQSKAQPEGLGHQYLSPNLHPERAVCLS